MPLLRGALVQADGPDAREVPAPHGLVPGVPEDPPDAVRVHPGLGRDPAHRPRAGEVHEAGLHQGREPRAFPRPRDADLVHPAGGARHAGDPDRQGGLVLDEGQGPPGPAAGVPHRAPGSATDRAGEPAPLGEVHGQIETALLHGEADVGHLPGRLQPQGPAKQLMLEQAVPSPRTCGVGGRVPGEPSVTHTKL